jgi:hypothetical protein
VVEAILTRDTSDIGIARELHHAALKAVGINITGHTTPALYVLHYQISVCELEGYDQSAKTAQILTG